MDYETARRIRNRSVKELTIRNLQQGGGIIGSYKSAIGSKFTASATRIKEKFDPLNYISMLNSPLTTAIVGRLFGRKGSTIRYFTEKQQAREREKNTHRTKIGPGRVTRLRVGDSSADILAKMFNLLQKDHDESLKRWELEQQHNQERKDKEDKRHQELLNAISKMGGAEQTKKTKGKSFFEKFKEEMVKIFEDIKKGFVEGAKSIMSIFDDIWVVFKDVMGGLLTVFDFLAKIGTRMVDLIFNSILGLVEKIIPGASIIFGAFKKFKNSVILKFIEHAQKIDKLATIVSTLSDAMFGGGLKSKNKFGKTMSVILGGVGGLTLAEQLKSVKTEDEKNEAIDKFYEANKDNGFFEENPEALSLLGALQKTVISDIYEAVGPLISYANELLESTDTGKFIKNAVGKSVGELMDQAKIGPGTLLAMRTEGGPQTILQFGARAYQYRKKNNLSVEEAYEDPTWQRYAEEYKQNFLIPAMTNAGIEYDKNNDEFIYEGEVIPPSGVFYARALADATIKKETQKKSKLITDALETKSKLAVEKFFGIDDKEITKAEEQLQPLNIKRELEHMRYSASSMETNLSDITDKLKSTYDEVFKNGEVIVNKITNNVPAPPAKEITEDGVPSVRTEDPSLLRCQMNSAIAC